MEWSRGHMQGFSALELLVIVVIVCVVAAIGIPLLHARAKISVLIQNLQTLGQMVQEQVIEGYSCDYRPSGEGDPAIYLSTHLQESLDAMGKAGYANPTVDSGNRRVVLNSSTISTYQYQAFPGLAEDDGRLLAGTLVVSFNPEARTVDVFYVNGDGRRSADVMSLPVG
jgi:type II secretory pathway pseudopilin PulG